MFDGSNYVCWKAQLKVFLSSLDELAWESVNGQSLTIADLNYITPLIVRVNRQICKIEGYMVSNDCVRLLADLIFMR